MIHIFIGFWVGICNGSSRACLLVLSLRVVAGRKVETTESCGDDAGDVGVDELEEPVDKPGTTIGMLFSVLQCIRLHHGPHFWWVWGFDRFM